MIPVNQKPFRLNLQNFQIHDNELFKILSDINKTWADIDNLNFIYLIIFKKITDKNEDLESISKLYSSLILLANNFYIYLGIIQKLLDKLKKEYSHDYVTGSNAEKWKQISIIRNNIIVHKEKPNFIRPTGSFQSISKNLGIDFVLLVGNRKIAINSADDVLFVYNILREINRDLYKISNSIK